jgi:hypothetical protein
MRLEIALYELQIGATDAAGSDVEQDLARARRRIRSLIPS